MSLDQFLPALFIVLLAVAVALVIKNHFDHQLDLNYHARAVQLGGHHQRRLADFAGRSMRWIRLSPTEFELCSHDAVLASLFFGDDGRLVSGRSFENLWVAHYHGWPGLTYAIHPYQAELPQATIEQRLGLGGVATAEFANGQIYSFRNGICRSPSGLQLFSCRGRGPAVTIEPEARLVPDLALLVLVGGALVIPAGNNDA